MLYFRHIKAKRNKIKLSKIALTAIVALSIGTAAYGKNISEGEYICKTVEIISEGKKQPNPENYGGAVITYTKNKLKAAEFDGTGEFIVLMDGIYDHIGDFDGMKGYMDAGQIARVRDDKNNVAVELLGYKNGELLYVSSRDYVSNTINGPVKKHDAITRVCEAK